MAIRKIIRMGHPSLRIPADNVAEEFIGSPAMQRLLLDMTDTLRDYGGVGLAAPQIDEPLRMAQCHCKDCQRADWKARHKADCKVEIQRSAVITDTFHDDTKKCVDSYRGLFNVIRRTL